MLPDVVVSVPPQALTTAGDTTTNPDGNVSVKPTPFSVTVEFGLVTVIFKTVVWLIGT